MPDRVPSAIAIVFVCVTLGVTAVKSSQNVNESVSYLPFSTTTTTTTTSVAHSHHHHHHSSVTSTTTSLNQTLQQVRRNIIRGSNSAVTITQRKYLKKEMCTSAPLQQVVRHRGCHRRPIVNRFCYGQCNSFFIPKTVPSDQNEEASLDQTAFKSCSFCRPKTTRWIRVLLHCPRSSGGAGTRPTTVRKKVEIVVQCSCTALTIS